MTYVEAMKCLLEGNYQPVIRETGDGSTCLKAKSRKEFQLPEPYKNEKRVLAYLSRTRFVDYEILMFFIERGAIYEEMRRHNAVFVGFDNQGKARHAHMKGAYTNVSRCKRMFMSAARYHDQKSFGKRIKTGSPCR